MTQKIFDTDNAEDMALLWSILPDKVLKIHTSEEHIYYSEGDETQYFDVSDLIAINWHDKTEITRPIQEATFDDVGKLCIFWDEKAKNNFGILEEITSLNNELRFWKNNTSYKHCRRLTKKEISELC
jgi:hypothetical protein